MTGKDPSFGSNGFHQLLFTIQEVTAGYAYGTDNFNRNLKIPVSIQRAKGVQPAAGEQWLLTKDLGPWTFAAIMNNANTTIVESVVAGTNVTVDNTDPANPIVSASGGGGGAVIHIHSVNNNLPSDSGHVYLTVQNYDAASPTTGPGFFTGTVSGTGWIGEGTFWLDSSNNVLGGTWTAIFQLEISLADTTPSTDVVLDTVNDKTDPYTYEPIYHFGGGGEKTFLAGALTDYQHNQFWTLGEAGTAGSSSYMPPGNSTPSDWPGAYTSMFFDQSSIFIIRGGEFYFTQPGLFVQGPTQDITGTITDIGVSYPAVYRGAVPEGGGGPEDIGSLGYPKANVWVDATSGAPGLWVSDTSGTPHFIGAAAPQLPIYTSPGGGITLIDTSGGGHGIQLNEHGAGGISLYTTSNGPINLQTAGSGNISLTSGEGVGLTGAAGVTLTDTSGIFSGGIILTSDNTSTGIQILTTASGGRILLDSSLYDIQLSAASNITLDSGTLVILSGTTGVQINSDVGFFGTTPVAQPTITGSRGGNAALASLLTALADYGLIIDSST